MFVLTKLRELIRVKQKQILDNHTLRQPICINDLWQHPPADLTLSNGEIHIWCASLNQAPASFQRLEQTLSKDEHLKAERFYFDQDRKHFIVGRGVLRIILNRYLGFKPNWFDFSYNSHGKPYLTKKFGDGNFKFNLAHSHELALYAFTRVSEIGVDIEYIKFFIDINQIAIRFFSANEYTIFSNLPTSQKREAFYNCWTRKEAYIKAIGDGLVHPLDKFDVSLAPGEQARLIRVEGKPEEASRWSLVSLTPAPNYVAALAVEGHDWHLSCWQFPELK